jgi:hypothetical protein
MTTISTAPRWCCSTVQQQRTTQPITASPSNRMALNYRDAPCLAASGMVGASVNLAMVVPHLNLLVSLGSIPKVV